MASILRQPSSDLISRVRTLGGTPEEQAQILAGARKRENNPPSLDLFLKNLERLQKSKTEFERAGKRGIDVVRK